MLPRLPRRTLPALAACALLAGALAIGASPSRSVLASPGAAAAAGPAPEQLTRVRLGELGILAGAGYYVAIEKGFFAEQGIEVDTTRFTTAAEMIAPLAAGQIDAGAGAISAGLFNAMARGVELKVVADQGHTQPGYPGNALMIRRDLVDSGQVRSAADLRGRRIAVPSASVGLMTDLRAFLGEGGLIVNDARIDEMSFPDMLPALANSSIDAAVTVEPFVTFTVQRGLGVLWRWDAEVNPDHQIGVILYGPGLVREQPDVGRRWMAAYVRGLRYFNDGFVRGDAAAREETIAALMQRTVVRERALYDTMALVGLDPDGALRLPSMRADQEFFVQLGLQERLVDLETVVDPQFVQYARQVLGPY